MRFVLRSFALLKEIFNIEFIQLHSSTDFQFVCFFFSIFFHPSFILPWPFIYQFVMIYLHVFVVVVWFFVSLNLRLMKDPLSLIKMIFKLLKLSNLLEFHKFLLFFFSLFSLHSNGGKIKRTRDFVFTLNFFLFTGDFSNTVGFVFGMIFLWDFHFVCWICNTGVFVALLCCKSEHGTDLLK